MRAIPVRAVAYLRLCVRVKEWVESGVKNEKAVLLICKIHT